MTEYALAWDIETVLDLPATSRAYGLGDAPNAKIRDALNGEFPKLPLHKIVCIGALVSSRTSDGWVVDSLGAPNIGERSEKELISAFIDRIGSLKPQLVTFNGGSFDLPVLRYRAMLNRINGRGLFVRNYFNRYSEDSIDLCDVLASYDARAKVRLDLVCKALNLSGKPSGLDGSSVEKYVADGRIKEVSDYCEVDVVNTYQLWLLYELFTGHISDESWAFSDRNLRSFISDRIQSKPHLRRILA